MDDPEGGGTPPRPPAGGGTPSASSAVRYNAPSTSRSSISSPGKFDRPLKDNKATSAQIAMYNSLFSSNNRSYDKFFIISSTEPSRSLDSVNTVKANKELESCIGGKPLDVKELRSGSVLVEVATSGQSDKILKLPSLAGCKVQVKSNDRMNQYKGTIYYRNSPAFTDQEIAEAINETCEAKVVDVYRMKKMVDNKLVELPIYLLTFQTILLPNYVKIGWTRCNTRTYIPRPRRCFKCCEFGHGAKTCRNPSVCMVCGEASGSDEETHPNPCLVAPKCPNCNGPHAATSRECPRYVKEQLVLTTQAMEGLTYQAARRKVFKEKAKKLPPTTRPSSFAEAA